MKRFVQWSVLASLLSMGGAAYAETQLGRLFYTPAERRALDQREVAGAQTDEGTTRPTMTLNGRIIRSDGKTVMWTNGSFAESEALLPIARSEELKVGQSIELMTGEVQDRLKGGRVVVRSKP